MTEAESKLKAYDLFTSTNEEATQVAAELKSIGCCPRCVLRFLGESDPYSFRCQQEDIDKLFISGDTDVSTNGPNKSPCPSCLGILQKFADREFLLKVVDKVKEDGFSFIDYQCSLMLPICIIAREKSIYLHLCKKFGVTYRGKEGDIPSVKEIWKWSCGYILSDLLEARFQNQSQFDIKMTFNYADFEKELSFLLDTDPDTFRRRKQQKKYGFETFTRVNVAKGISEMSDSKFEDCFSCPPTIPVIECTCDIVCGHDSVFVAGRYQKYSRVLSQTPWIVDGKRIFEGSVEDYICDPMTEMFKPSEHRLSSSGREDVDVRMLGTGRPFVIELINPHCVRFSQADIKRLQEAINESTRDVQVRDLQIVERVDLNSLKDGEINKKKCYSAICWCERELTQGDLDMLEGMKDLTIHQKTPLRVLHRRSAMTRDRVIYSMKAENMDNNRFKLSLQTQAGTYIKEFVHGDFGRTTPNLCEILQADTDIIDLDVEAVDVDWPPYIDEIPENGSNTVVDHHHKQQAQLETQDAIHPTTSSSNQNPAEMEKMDDDMKTSTTNTTVTTTQPELGSGDGSH